MKKKQQSIRNREGYGRKELGTEYAKENLESSKEVNLTVNIFHPQTIIFDFRLQQFNLIKCFSSDHIVVFVFCVKQHVV